MRALALLVMLIVVSSSPAYSAEASLQDRQGMSQEVADQIHDGYFRASKTNPFKTDAVQIGAAVTYKVWQPEYEHYALADWRSIDGTQHGQAFFFYLCDHWNLGNVSLGRPLTVKEIMSHGMSPPSASVAEKLLASLAQLEAQHVAYLKPAKWSEGC